MVSRVPRWLRKSASAAAGGGAGRRGSERYSTSASFANLPTATSRSLRPLPRTRATPRSRSRCARSSPTVSEARVPRSTSARGSRGPGSRAARSRRGRRAAARSPPPEDAGEVARRPALAEADRGVHVEPALVHETLEEGARRREPSLDRRSGEVTRVQVSQPATEGARCDALRRGHAAALEETHEVGEIAGVGLDRVLRRAARSAHPLEETIHEEVEARGLGGGVGVSRQRSWRRRFRSPRTRFEFASSSFSSAPAFMALAWARRPARRTSRDLGLMPAVKPSASQRARASSSSAPRRPGPR